MINRSSINKISPFLTKLFQIVNNEEYKNIISWNSEGDSFIIFDFSIFCDEILPKYFKHRNFASFVRQLNMYDFHKTRQNNTEQAFQHNDALTFIKRKNYNEPVKKEVNTRKKRVDLEGIKKESMNISNILEDLKKRVNTLEGKHTYLEICHSELAHRNLKIKSQLSSLNEKEKQLENLLIYALKNFAPNFFIKNSDLKFFENSAIEDDNYPIPSKNNQLIEMNKSTFQKNELLNKIFKEIKNLIQYYYIVNNVDGTTPNLEMECIPETSNILSDIKNTPGPSLDNEEILYNNQVTEFQNRIYNYLNESNKHTSNINNININNNAVTTMKPKKSSSIQIIENNCKFGDMPNPNSSFFQIVQNKYQDVERKECNSISLSNKRKRNSNSSIANPEIYEKIFPSSNYKLEK